MPTKAMTRTQSGSAENGTRLEQNAPNPFSTTTVIGYYLPVGKGSAQIEVLTTIGLLPKTLPVTQSGRGQLTLSAGVLPVGTYQYVLKVGGTAVASKQMIVLK